MSETEGKSESPDGGLRCNEGLGDDEEREEMAEEPEEEKSKYSIDMGDLGCGWLIGLLIVCVTIYHLAELYFAHHK